MYKQAIVSAPQRQLRSRSIRYIRRGFSSPNVSCMMDSTEAFPDIRILSTLTKEFNGRLQDAVHLARARFADSPQGQSGSDKLS
jgi:hypothetical protein